MAATGKCPSSTGSTIAIHVNVIFARSVVKRKLINRCKRPIRKDIENIRFRKLNKVPGRPIFLTVYLKHSFLGVNYFHGISNLNVKT